MKKMLNSFVLFIAVVLQGAVYIVPQEYDNMLNATKSSGYGLITQTSVLSGNTYTIGGRDSNFRCLKVPKISCVASTPDISANISEASLRSPNTESLLDTFQLDLRIEEDANSFYLCGGGYGGQVYDTSTLTSTTVSGDKKLTYTYIPNSQSKEFYYFTDQANASTTSYISVSYHQMCL